MSRASVRSSGECNEFEVKCQNEHDFPPGVEVQVHACIHVQAQVLQDWKAGQRPPCHILHACVSGQPSGCWQLLSQQLVTLSAHSVPVHLCTCAPEGM